MFVCLIFSVRSAWGQSRGKKSLAGLNGVEVKVSVGEVLEGTGLNEAEIKTNTEIQLRKAGIEVYTDEERLDTPAAPRLYIKADAYEYDGLLAFEYSALVDQVVQTMAGNHVLGTTWNSSGSVGMVGIDSVQDLVDAVRQDVRIFINDWLAVHEQ
jgi:hypothetical protein